MAVERGDGSDHVHGLDLRSPQTTCCRSEGGAPADAEVTGQVRLSREFSCLERRANLKN
jgi:hypothetical protein